MKQNTPSNDRAFREALVIGATGGIGEAVATNLAKSGTAVRHLSRSIDGFDLSDETTIIKAASNLSLEGCVFDLIFLATGILEAGGLRPEKSFAELDPEAMLKAFTVNAIGPALCFKHFSPLLAKTQQSVFAALSARVGSIGDNRLGGWMSYRASKTALNQIVRCAALEISRSRPNATVVALHPGTIETELTRRYSKGKYTATPKEAAAQIISVVAGLSVNQTGSFLAYDGKKIEW